jgi:hypothetical protein
MRFWKPKRVPGAPIVGLGVAAHFADERQLYACWGLACALKAQTWPRWRAHIIHDGPTLPLPSIVGLLTFLASDPRFTYEPTAERKKQFGHPHRQRALDYLTGVCDWVGLTNQDNYYAPSYFEMMLGEAHAAKTPVDFVYSDMVHSHRLWKPMVTKPKKSHLDLGAWLARSELVKQVPFDQTGFAADGDYIDRLVKRAKGLAKVNAALFVHN